MKLKRVALYSLATLIIVLFIALLAAIFSASHPHKPSVEIKCRLELRGLSTALNGYQDKYTNYPAGNQVQVIKSLLGENPQEYKFLNADVSQLRSDGEYLDPWGTPYAIRFPSTNSFIVRSAGKDKIFDDADDIIFNSVSNDFVKP